MYPNYQEAGGNWMDVEGFGPILHFAEIDSTQIFARLNASALPSPTAIVADKQTRGHGRKRRVWVSPPGCLMFSLIADLTPEISDALAIISPIISVRIVQYLRTIPGCGEVGVKWPNDVYWRGKKLCGILTDAIACGDEMKLIIGMGLNVTNDGPPEAVNLAAISPEAPLTFTELRDALMCTALDAVTHMPPFDEFQAMWDGLMGPSTFTKPGIPDQFTVLQITEAGGVLTDKGEFTPDDLADAEWVKETE